MIFENNSRYIKSRALPDLLPFGLNRTLKRHSNLYLTLLGRYYSLIESYNESIKINDETRQEGWELVKNDLQEMHRLSRENDTKFLVVAFPDHSEVIRGGTELSMAEKITVQEFSEESGVPVYDLTDELVDHDNTKTLYLEDGEGGRDLHFSPVGNRYVANLVAIYLRKNLLTPHFPSEQ